MANITKLEDKDSKNIEKVVIFTIDAELYGLPVTDILEIVEETPVTKIPNSPDFIEGLINLRGKIVTLVDIEKRFNLERINSRPRNRKFIIVESADSPFGIAVDKIIEIKSIPMGALQTPPEVVKSKLGAEFIRGIYIDTPEIKNEAGDTLMTIGKYNENEKTILVLNFRDILKFKEVTKK